MINNWYNRIMGQPSQSSPKNTGAAFQNPIQQAQYIANAMRNPVAFVKEFRIGLGGDEYQFVKQMQQVSGPQRR